MNHDDFVIAEYNQLYELVRHYADAQRQFFQMFLTAFGAVCAGYFALETNPALNHLSNKLLVLGFVGNLFFLALIVSNRAYFQINFRKVEYFRQRFLYTNPDEWRDYPLQVDALAKCLLLACHDSMRSLGNSLLPDEISRVMWYRCRMEILAHFHNLRSSVTAELTVYKLEREKHSGEVCA
jgi:hypothetical protein